MIDRTGLAGAFATPSDFAGQSVLVCGTGLAGRSAVQALLALDAHPLVTADLAAPPEPPLPAGARFIGPVSGVPAGVTVVVTSPGLPPMHPVLRDAARSGIPVLGELEFAWRLRGPDPASWLMVTGTNGKTTVVRMLESTLRAAGLRALAVGNVGVPAIEAVLAEPAYQVLAVEASSFQLHYSSTIAPWAGALLNLAEDHLDWHASMAAYAIEKTKVWKGDRAIGNADDAAVMRLLDGMSPPARTAFTLSEPVPGQYGVRAGWLVDGAGAALLPASEVRPAGPHNVANALAAAALAGTVGVTGAQVATGLRSFVPDPHRNQLLAPLHGVDWVDDSKATNPHAAAASLSGYRRIVWIAGGQLKGASVDGLVREFAGRMVGAVLLGTDRDEIKLALARHAPNLPVIEVSRTDDGAMHDVVAAAASLAGAGDVVLLAPAAASKDMFSSYGARGKAFSDAVDALRGGGSGSVASA